ncbi:hypothetical protein CEXT_210441 [Caerostris extrusa]|uniref:WAP domain-containing protein n=1 Tax=Caerostris extrusa TaxID=172846 RepID=A0AAV4UPI9_CAEEX|nr:hypothetical protein CEXT_210441 [Caerostris extrusa]
MIGGSGSNISGFGNLFFNMSLLVVSSMFMQSRIGTNAMAACAFIEIVGMNLSGDTRSPFNIPHFGLAASAQANCIEDQEECQPDECCIQDGNTSTGVCENVTLLIKLPNKAYQGQRSRILRSVPMFGRTHMYPV